MKFTSVMHCGRDRSPQKLMICVEIVWFHFIKIKCIFTYLLCSVLFCSVLFKTLIFIFFIFCDDNKFAENNTHQYIKFPNSPLSTCYYQVPSQNLATPLIYTPILKNIYIYYLYYLILFVWLKFYCKYLREQRSR